MGDVDYQVTTVLERANYTLKDNRIPPVGFTTSHLVYDTVKIVGEALTDEDFNHIDGIEGSGSDIVHYNIPTDGYTGDIEITSNIYYQTVNPKWLEEMFSYSSDEINMFRDMFNSADKQPVLMSENTLTSIFTNVDESENVEIKIFPNPGKGKFHITGVKFIEELSVYDISGKLIKKEHNFNTQNTLNLNEENGIYIINIRTSNKINTKKIIVRN